MLIKARVCAGDLALGRELLEFVEPLIYSTTLDFRAVEAVSEARERISEKLAAKRARAGLDIKLAPGGIRDIEFLVQCLQRLHGGRETLGAAWRHAVCAFPRARQEPAFRQRVRAPGFRLRVPAPHRAPPAVLRRPADPHACPPTRRNWRCWRARCRPNPASRSPRNRSKCAWRSIWATCGRCTRVSSRRASPCTTCRSMAMRTIAGSRWTLDLAAIRAEQFRALSGASARRNWRPCWRARN